MTGGPTIALPAAGINALRITALPGDHPVSQLPLVDDDQQLPLSALIDRARAAEQTGAFNDALVGYHAAIERIHTGEQPYVGPSVLRWIGRIHFERGEYDEAQSAFEASLVNAQALNLRRDAAGALNGMAVVEQFRGRLDVAEALYVRACILADDACDYQLAAMIDQNLGTLANVRGDLSTALMRYQAALARFRELKNEKAASCTLNNMGMLHVDVGAWSAAESCYKAAYQLAEHIGDDNMRAKVETNRAELYIKRQHYEHARECLERGFKLFSQIGSEPGLAEIHKFYGVLYRETGKPQVAHVQLGLALSLARSCENPLLEAEVESERARLFMSEKHAREALRSLNRAYRIFCDLDARREILDVKRRLERLERSYLQALELWEHDTPAQAEPPEGLRRGKRVADLAAMLADGAQYADVIWLRIGAFLRDVGNQVLPPELLDKPGPLSAEEWELVRRHTELGASFLNGLDFPEEIRSMVRNHHEHWDGSGYPDGLAREGIPLAARILCIADVYDALTTRRSYREAFSSEQALAIMEAESGTIFDPALFHKFATLMRKGGPDARPRSAEKITDAI
jgi:response regulator RpfG family c-di-GMP phosphodiesterase